MVVSDFIAHLHVLVSKEEDWNRVGVFLSLLVTAGDLIKDRSFHTILVAAIRCGMKSKNPQDVA